MSSLGEAWDETTPGSASKKNLTSVISSDGAYLASLDKTKFKIVVCTSDGSGFELDHAYLFTEDGTSKIDMMAVQPHSHEDDNDGGPLTQVYGTNSLIANLWLTKPNDLKTGTWTETVTGTGTMEYTQDGTTKEYYVRLRPNGTSGSGSTISLPHLKLDFSQRSNFNAKLKIETATSIALHTGVNCDDVTASDSNTVKYNAEVCTATNSNWFVRTADGSNKSSSDTGIAISANLVAIALDHRPEAGTPRVDIYIDANDVFSKTTNIPVSGTSTYANLIKDSVKNSTGSDRPLRVYGHRIAYTINDTWN